MRVFKVADGTSWVAKLHDGSDHDAPAPDRVGWEVILFLADPAAVAERLVYRPAGWLAHATLEELVAALEEGVVVRARWGTAR
ncbi:MAG TPA: hypothetical protein VE620_08830 [Myxococcales bacterium]|jgi:hypothetical protein|nr:hypothetical protein [Myxococcales bacterium]